MYNRILGVMSGFIAVAAMAGSQPQRAAIVGGGNPNVGQCIVGVVVDGTAEIEVRGDNGTLRDIGGAPPQWRRFECTSAMPPNPANFQFAGLNGRGHQNLIAEPRNGGPAVVRIEDSEGGASEYTFRLTWSTGQNSGPVGARDDRGYQGNRGPDYRGYQGDRGTDPDAYYRDRDASFRGNNGRAMFFQRIREDLDHATSGAFPFTGDRARLERTQMELDELQQKLARGFYDERELDETMGALQAVLQANRMAPRDRAILTDDLKRMSDFRIRHDEYGARVGDPDRRENRQAMFFQRIREDLDRATVDASRFGGDRYRLDRTKQELDELQSKLARGFYDERELDEVMGAMRAVVDSNRLAPRDRDALADDLTRMADFRARHDRYGAR